MVQIFFIKLKERQMGFSTVPFFVRSGGMYGSMRCCGMQHRKFKPGQCLHLLKKCAVCNWYPPCLKQAKYNKCPSVQWLFQVNDFREFTVSPSSKIRPYQRKKKLNCTFEVSCVGMRLWGPSSVCHYCMVSRLWGKDRSIFVLLLGLNLGLLGFPSIPNRSVVIY